MNPLSALDGFWHVLLSEIYDSVFSPLLLWFSAFILILSLSLCLSTFGPCTSPLLRPVAAPPWEISCGLALPSAPPWRHTYRPPRRRLAQFFLLRRVERRLHRFPPCITLPWLSDDASPPLAPFRFSSCEADSLDRLPPLQHFQHFQALHGDRLIQTVSQRRSTEAAFVAAASLRSTFKAADLSWSPPSLTNQYILHLFDDSVIPVVVDTGASVSITPDINDFIGPISPPDLPSLQGLGNSSVVEGVGTVEWQVRDFLGNVRTIRTKAYLVRTAPVRLLSPQTYFKEGLRGRLTVTHDRTELTLHDGSILSLPFADNHLPYLFPDWQPVVGLTRDDASLLGSAPTVALSVADETNQNLTSSQKELLLWHWRLGHSHFSWVQRLASAPRTDRRHILTTKTTCSTASPPCCAACSLAKLKRRTPPGPVGGIAPPAMQIRSDDLHPGDCISVDQYVSSVPGRLPHTAGKESLKDKYHGGTIFVDHATSFLFLVNQVSLRAGETIHSKVAFERFAHSCGHRLQSFRADNMPFDSAEFKADLVAKNQTISLSGVGAHHQNGVAERSIQTVTEWARAMLLHHALHWPEQAQLDLWPFALEHAVYLWNHLPRKDSLLAPIELFTGATFDDYSHLQRSRVWGCPVYVLDPTLQDGKKLPKWSPRSRRGMFLGVSPSHSSSVGRILNLRTGHVSPQYHVVYDELFSTVFNSLTPGMNDALPFDDALWTRLISIGLEHLLPSSSDDSRQVDYTAAFVHAPLHDVVYVCMPRGFAEEGKVLKLRRSLYGLKQSPRNFFLHLKSNLEACGFRNPSPDTDPCLFVSGKVVCVVYVDDTLLWSPHIEWIDEAIAQLEANGMALEVEDSVAGFLGVHIHRDQGDGSIKLTQKGLILRIIAALGIEKEPAVHTPAAATPLVKDLDGDPPDGSFNYASVIGMLGYLQSNSRPDIAFAVSSAARFTHHPRRSHELALKRIGQYLKGTIEDGLVLRPSDTLDIDCYVDADFAGLWPHEDKSDPSCVKSRTGFSICVANCPVIWSSKLQGDIATSTMEAEYSALSSAMRELLPFRDLLLALAPSIGVNTDHSTVFRTTVHEDNAGALALAHLEPGRVTPRSKHYAVKLHWFRSKLVAAGPHPITIVKIDTALQRADILTKALTKNKFVVIRKQLCGW
ncbi:reverse transcriptase RNA-dependent DNA polymerase [Nitzschia inconspicua]|uniref:Reverse transcriptase RNA-dependent DNA polymerase n=1 Tax=Nitzschia inconspicua TaxID=303405 RepID=A0A9K3LXW0_9STRA|nr:reverse transcriptase RNA-dependent DNA polymerase [Nitzschia inconspicua]